MSKLYYNSEFIWDLLRNSDLFAKLTQIVPYTIEEAYRKARRFVNLKRELKLDKKNKTIMEVALGKEKNKGKSK